MQHNSNQFFIEFIAIGNQVKVSACDSLTGYEVSIIVPRNTPKEYATSIAIKKLNYMLKKNS